MQYREARDNLEEVERLRQEEDAKRLSLDLEREKGRLAGEMWPIVYYLNSVCSLSSSPENVVYYWSRGLYLHTFG